jgi:ElaB/YqjD/DUF883 family membrane-anchored ribosome-binding protein
MSQTLVDKTADYITESAQQVARKTSSIADAIEDGAPVIKRAAKQASEAAEEFLDDSTKLVQRNLWASMAAMLVLGTMIGWMMKRR